jgi:acyl carrier protein
MSTTALVVKQIVARYSLCTDSSFSTAQPLDQLGVDARGLAGIANSLEVRFGVKVSVPEATRWVSTADIVAFVDEKQRRRSL